MMNFSPIFKFNQTLTTGHVSKTMRSHLMSYPARLQVKNMGTAHDMQSR